jgi:plastocyanin
MVRALLIASLLTLAASIASAATVTITIQSSDYRPGDVLVHEGDVIHFMNMDNVAHAVTNGRPAQIGQVFDHTLQPGESWDWVVANDYHLAPQNGAGGSTDPSGAYGSPSAAPPDPSMGGSSNHDPNVGTTVRLSYFDKLNPQTMKPGFLTIDVSRGPAQP